MLHVRNRSLSAAEGIRLSLETLSKKSIFNCLCFCLSAELNDTREAQDAEFPHLSFVFMPRRGFHAGDYIHAPGAQRGNGFDRWE